MENSMINSFISVTVSLFQNMFSLDSSAGDPFELIQSDNHDWDISGIVGLAGAAQGIIAFRVGQTFAENLFAASGVKFTSEEGMIDGLIAEVTNIISGNAISEMAEIDVAITPPVVIQGNNHKISWPKIAPVTGIIFSTSKGDFEVDICFKR